MSNPVETSDHALSQYLGPSLQSATIRLAGALIAVAAIGALVIKVL